MTITKNRPKINPKILKWAREDLGYDEYNLPDSSIIKKNYKKWEDEHNNSYPTWKQLEEICKKYKRPPAFFFRTQPPETEPENEIEYRTLTEHTYKKSPQLKYNIRLSKNRQEIYKELLNDTGISISPFKRIKQIYDTDPKKLSENIRIFLGISIEEQKKWNNKKTKHYEQLKRWKEILNDIGILIFETYNVDEKEMRALTIYDDTTPFILLNGKDEINGRIFSLFHELTHLIMGESAICDFSEQNKVEIFCNDVAGNFLVPEGDLKKNEIVVNNKSKEWEDKDLRFLSNEYGVSKEVILRRLLKINETTKEFYNSRKKVWDKKKKEDEKSKNGGGDYFRNQIKYNGEMYSKMIISAYRNNIISLVDFSDYLNIDSSHIETIESMLW